MINFGLIGIKLGEGLKYDTSINEINRVATAIFDFKISSHPQENITSSRSQLIYDWVMTLAKKSIDEERKLTLLQDFINALTPKDSPLRNLIKETTRMETKMSITEEDIKKLTVKQLARLAKNLSLGACIFIIAIFGFFIFSSYKVGHYIGYNKGISQLSRSKQEMTLEQLNEDQISLVREIWKYQKSNRLNKVIICKDGFIFDEANKKETTINLSGKVLGNRGDQYRFERLILSIPVYFLKRIPVTIFGNRYVVTIPEKARKILDEK